MQTTQSPQQPLAVVGMACRLPGNSNSPTALWRFLEQGGIASTEPPASRFNLHGHEDGTKRIRTMRSPGGMFLENIDPADIDAQFFGLSRAEATAMDPQQRQLLEVVYEGLENAGITLESLRNQPVGCFVGSYASDWGDMQGRDPEDRVPNATVGVGRAMLSNRLSHFLNIKGPSMTIDTACSGSLVSLDIAARYLQTGEIDTAIVAGCNLYMSPEHCIDMSNLSGAASPSGRCHTFDAKADGYIKAEAVNMVILKRLPDALRQHDPIRAIVRGSATNSDGWTAGIASPSPEAQAAATRQAYRNAGISNLNDTSYVECHGTGTRAGDPIEVNSVASVFCATRTAERPLLIGSIKSNVGHSEPAAGLSGLIKTIMSLEKGCIPGNPTFETPNPAINFEALKTRAFQRTIQWPDVPFRRASVNSYGYGGSNVHVILDEASTSVPPSEASFKSSYLTDDDDLFADQEQESFHLLVFSANDEASLKATVQRLQMHLVRPEVRVSLPDLAYTLSERRTRHFHRAYLVSNTPTVDQHALIYGKLRSNVPKVGFIFTGQGSQWPQMGKALVDTFPSSQRLLRQLDAVLQALPHPPQWSLYDELTCPRSSDHVRQPELSQPLVTALQLLIIDLLKTWCVQPASVVGHSSGEIAAAVAAGLLEPEDAIQIAYYRGKAAVDLRDDSRPKLGMMAAGLSDTSPLLQQILQRHSGAVALACINSPQSVTLSGHVSALETVCHQLHKHGHFARLLQVDLPYHSPFMADIAAHYKSLLDARGPDSSSPASPRRRGAKFFSSVTGCEMQGSVDNAYWEANMRLPVRFSEAVEAMLTDADPVDFLIEVGPSGALAGPIKQILKALPSNSAGIEYHAACRRNTFEPTALFDVAGRLFLADGPININQVNATARAESARDSKPAVLVDLPNYMWNHATKYWWESQASRDWRFRRYPNHDLLGGKVLGTPWTAPVWQKLLRLPELTWLLDHRIGGQVLFPAAGYIAMAVEAAFQMGQSRGFIDQNLQVHNVAYRLRNVTFMKAMVLEEGTDQRIMLTLTPEDESADSWHHFTVLTLHEDATTTRHCSGMIMLETPYDEDAPWEAIKPLEYPMPAQAWYKALRDVGYSFGPSFQSQLEVEAVAGQRTNRGLVSFSEPPSSYPQSPYSIHPVAIDGCLQSGAASLWQGIRSAVGGALVPAVVDDLLINARDVAAVPVAVAAASAAFSGVGSPEEAHNYHSHIQVFDPASKRLLLKVTGLWYHNLDASPESPERQHTFMRLHWKPQMSTLSDGQVRALVQARRSLQKPRPHHDPSSPSQKQWTLMELLLHEKHSLQVAEFSTLPFEESVGRDMFDGDLSFAEGNCKYQFMPKNLASMRASQALLSETYPQAQMNMLDVTKPDVDLSMLPDMLDLAILQLGPVSSADLANALANVRRAMTPTAYLLVLGTSLVDITEDTGSASVISGEDSDSGSSDWSMVGGSSSQILDFLRGQGFERVVPLAQESLSEDTVFLAQLSSDKTIVSPPLATTSEVTVLHLTPEDKPLVKQLAIAGKAPSEQHLPLPAATIAPSSVVVIVDEVYSATLTEVTPIQWQAIQHLTASGCKILWVTSGAQLDVTHPDRSLAYGMSRVIRAEDPCVNFTLLDVESAVSTGSLEAICRTILSLQQGHQTQDHEFVERDGVVHVSRVYPDTQMNADAEKEDAITTTAALPPAQQTQNLHEHPSCVRLVCRQPGKLQSLCFAEVSSSPVPLPDDFIEVEMHAAGLNFKDVATCLGIVPENPYLLGLEGAGVVCRLGKGVTSFRVGQRVLVNRRGSFGNKVQCPVQGAHAIPDSMSFEEAASLPVVYLSVIRGLFDLANLQRGQSVLIHSAAGGVGQAAIQICQAMGADIYATVGNDAKRAVLTQQYNIPPERIYSSRTAAFAPRIWEATRGRGVDVILNTLTGRLLDESWRIVAAGGCLVELGKKDILGRRSLSMEPFNRNASYRALDMSHDSVTPQITAQLMTKMFELLASGSIRPIEPRTVFPYRDIAGAIRYMRGGEHIGKIIISREAPDNDPNVPIVPAPTQLRLRDDATYLIVGGLRGLCGSLAVYLACHGAKHLAVMSRSGFEDSRSRSVIRDLISLGTRVELVQGDVSCIKDVRRAFRQAVKPVRGIIQGAMVLKDKIYTSMTVDGFRDVLPCKVSGTWNLHAVAQEQGGVDLDFFTLLSSISGLVGQKGQANYAAAGAFQDAFATYRRDRGLAACAVDLGVIEDVGYISERQEIATRLDINIWTPINEALLHRILRASILDQHNVQARGDPTATAQIITGIPFPQPEGAMLLRDARFGALAAKEGSAATAAGKHGGLSQEMQTLLMLLQTSTADRSEQLAATIEVVNRHFMHSLGLAEPMEAAKPLSVYGLDSLAAVDFRNWLRQELEVVVSTLEVVGAKTLSALCERILSRLLENVDATVGERG
ncbi:type I Iterative Polyketide synthase (PKS) [Aspergillus tubingensis]|uniref:Type I Iterative Polyketide synthase (PKS) n=1 Tax=Aspergillus tubingensis TaxID=5068 RepID=A0A9W6ENP2_ASPTU|nr:type I Iterative Polyketide synthase (PKS) [Aspergillus tubingensis]